MMISHTEAPLNRLRKVAKTGNHDIQKRRPQRRLSALSLSSLTAEDLANELIPPIHFDSSQDLKGLTDGSATTSTEKAKMVTMSSSTASMKSDQASEPESADELKDRLSLYHKKQDSTRFRKHLAKRVLLKREFKQA